MEERQNQYRVYKAWTSSAKDILWKASSSTCRTAKNLSTRLCPSKLSKTARKSAKFVTACRCSAHHITQQLKRIFFIHTAHMCLHTFALLCNTLWLNKCGAGTPAVFGNNHEWHSRTYQPGFLFKASKACPRSSGSRWIPASDSASGARFPVKHTFARPAIFRNEISF